MSLSAILGRDEYEISFPNGLRQHRILLTGGEGSIGEAIRKRLEAEDVPVLATDVNTLDVLRPNVNVVKRFKPTICIHLAADKHAPAGETHPYQTATLNIEGTKNMLDIGRREGFRVVTASTCKAANPETAYGASKLIAERMTLNAGGSVVRYYNCIETAGNVFRIWENMTGPLPVAECWRYFITVREAVGLTLWAASLPSGRYTIDPGRKRWMPQVAQAMHPCRSLTRIEPRKGDRIEEPRCAAQERLIRVLGSFPLMQITSDHDQSEAEIRQVA